MPGVDVVRAAKHGELAPEGVDHGEDEGLAKEGLGAGVLLPAHLSLIRDWILLYLVREYCSLLTSH